MSAQVGEQVRAVVDFIKAQLPRQQAFFGAKVADKVLPAKHAPVASKP